MVAYFSQLHQQIQVVFFLVLGSITILQKIFVNFQLNICEADINVNLLFWRESLLNLNFGSSEHERLQNLMQLANHLHILLLNFLF